MSLFPFFRSRQVSNYSNHSDSDQHGENTPCNEAQYPPYYYDLDDVQKDIYHKPFGPDGFPIDAWTDPYYEKWFFAHKATAEELRQQEESEGSFSFRPLFSVIVPLYKTPLDYFRAMADSVLAQTYRNVQLVLINASPEVPELAEEIEYYRLLDSRITVVTLDRNYGITENTNFGIEAAAGDYCCFLDHDDFIEPNTLFEYAAAVNDNPTLDILYCDEDLVIYDDERRCFHYKNPMFKPQFSPELLLCKNYVVHFLTIRKQLILDIEKPDARYDGAQDFNMLSRCAAKTDNVHGIQKVLYHWRISPASTATNPESKPYARRANRLAAFKQLEQRHISGSLVSSGIVNLHNVWFTNTPESCSIIVDCSDNEQELISFLEHLAESTISQNDELILVGSTSVIQNALNFVGNENLYLPATQLIERNGTRPLASYNIGARHSKRDYLIFIDSSCGFVTPLALGQLSALCSISGVGVSSPKSVYRDGVTKSLGVAITSECIMPLYRGYPDDFPAYQCNLKSIQNTSACSLQGLCISRHIFKEVNGFDEHFEGEIAAADLCKRVRDMGLRVAVTPSVKIEINEPSPSNLYAASSHQPDFSVEDLKKYDEKWPEIRLSGDPFLNSNLNQSSPYFQLTRP